jgi:ketosteroid isomerase-like protein
MSRDTSAALSTENVKFLTRWYDLFNERLLDELLAMLQPDFIYTSSGAFPDFDAVYRGREGFARFHETQAAAWEYFRVEVGSILDRGDHLIVEVHLHGKGLESGIEVNQTFHHAWHLCDGLAVRLDSRRNQAQALEAAGLSE